MPLFLFNSSPFSLFCGKMEHYLFLWNIPLACGLWYAWNVIQSDVAEILW